MCKNLQNAFTLKDTTWMETCFVVVVVFKGLIFFSSRKGVPESQLVYICTRLSVLNMVINILPSRMAPRSVLNYNDKNDLKDTNKGIETHLQTDFFFFICSEFCHTLKWNSHGFTCVPHPDPPTHHPLHLLPLGLPSAPGPSTCLMHPTWAGDLFHPIQTDFELMKNDSVMGGVLGEVWFQFYQVSHPFLF